MREARARPDGEAQATLEVEECDGAVLELLADDALGREAEAVAVERDRAMQVVHAQREHGDPWFHERTPSHPTHLDRPR